MHIVLHIEYDYNIIIVIDDFFLFFEYPRYFGDIEPPWTMTVFAEDVARKSVPSSYTALTVDRTPFINPLCPGLWIRKSTENANKTPPSYRCGGSRYVYVDRCGSRVTYFSIFNMVSLRSEP